MNWANLILPKKSWPWMLDLGIIAVKEHWTGYIEVELGCGCVAHGYPNWDAWRVCTEKCFKEHQNERLWK